MAEPEHFNGKNNDDHNIKRYSVPYYSSKFCTRNSNQVHYLWPSSVGSGGALILPDPLANTRYFILDQKVLL